MLPENPKCMRNLPMSVSELQYPKNENAPFAKQLTQLFHTIAKEA
jgi:hypothetical protein